MMPKLTETSIEKTPYFSHVFVEEDKVLCTEVDTLETIPRRHELSIDLNRPSFEGNVWEDREETEETSLRKKLGKKIILLNVLRNIIRSL